MRFYNRQHRFYCGVDLHARSMYVCILDQAGTVVFHENLPAADLSLVRRDEKLSAALRAAGWLEGLQ